MADITKPKHKGYQSVAPGVRKFVEVDPSGTEQVITAAGAINPRATRVQITGPAESTYAVTLAAPEADTVGHVMVIRMAATTATNAVTLALTNITGGSGVDSASFDAAGEELLLIAGVAKWFVIGEAGVTLSGS